MGEERADVRRREQMGGESRWEERADVRRGQM